MHIKHTEKYPQSFIEGIFFYLKNDSILVNYIKFSMWKIQSQEKSLPNFLSIKKLSLTFSPNDKIAY